MTRKNEFSLRRFTLSSAVWYATVVAGWALIAVGVIEVSTTPTVELRGALIMTATLVILLELLPLMQGRGHDPGGVVTSTAFTCALLIAWGIWPAILAVSVASALSDLRMRKAWFKVFFNPAQYTLSVAAAYLVMLVAGHPSSLAHPLVALTPKDLGWIVGLWIAYFVVNLVLVAGVLAWAGTFRSEVVTDFASYTTMTFAVLALSPLIVVVARVQWQLLPLLLVPVLLLYYASQLALQRQQAEGRDTLTGLPNRSTLRFALDEAYERYGHDQQPFGLVLIDLDDFRQVNDTLGHQVGDAMLVHFAQRLQAAVRSTDLVARLGGDEFAVLVLDTDEEGVCDIAARIHAANVHPIELEALPLEIAVSIGIAVCPQHALDATMLLQRADVALYTAKETHTLSEVYSVASDHNSTERLGLLAALRQALDDDALELYYQPKVSTRDGKPVGVEALVRWFHPTRGYIPPDDFIPLAERSGIMPLLTARVVSIALDQMARWRDEGIEIPVAVNIAPTDLIGDALTYLVAQGLAEYNVAPGMLQLEITERIETHQLVAANTTLKRLRTMGVAISLDDFGTGYSSLLRLSSLPVDEIKIDRAFVCRLPEGARAVGIVRAVIDLAHTFDVPSIAEGVETADELGILRSLGCDAAQGWHVGMPMPAAEATEWLRARLTPDKIPPALPVPLTA